MDLEAVIVVLGTWGVRSPSRLRDAALGVDSLVLSLRTMFDPKRAGDLRAVYELRLCEERFRAEVADGRSEIARGGTERPDAAIETDRLPPGRGQGGAAGTGPLAGVRPLPEPGKVRPAHAWLCIRPVVTRTGL